MNFLGQIYPDRYPFFKRIQGLSSCSGKKIILLLLTGFTFLAAYPQNFKQMHIVGNPTKLTDEVVAKLDANGEYAAAIQIITDLDGLDYDSNDGIVADVDRWPGKDMVYLTHRERILYVFKQGYEQLKIYLSDHGIILKPGEVWQIKIAGDEAADVLPVTFRFTPEDATLFIDEKNAGNKLTQELSVGEHQIKLVRDGYQTIEETIKVNKETGFFEWTMKKIIDAGLQINTEPQGATIYLDGVELGSSPVAVFYPPGTYPIKIEKKGYVTLEDESLEVTLPQTAKNYILKENVGYLTINTHPEATVYFNGEKVDDFTRLKLSPQIVQVKITMPKSEDLEQQVVIKKDDDIVLDMYPEIQTGTIQVAVTPFDATVELSGDAGENYNSVGMKIFNDIPIGVYVLSVNKKGFKTFEEQINLHSGERLSKRIVLTPGTEKETEEKITLSKNTRIGVVGGLGLTSLFTQDEDLSYESMMSYAYGINFQFFVSKRLLLGSGAYFERKGTTVIGSWGNGNATVVMDYLTVPAIVAVGTPDSRFQIGGGFYFGALLKNTLVSDSADIDLTDDTQAFDFGITFPYYILDINLHNNLAFYHCFMMNIGLNETFGEEKQTNFSGYFLFGFRVKL